ncbi:MAG TPA: response regulator [Verrucomicrobiae bacterium]|nr:response regulator [Verrucomicrobiae bacterium]
MTPSTKPNVILVAEDDSDDRLLAQDAFKEIGANLDVQFVEDGVELLDYLHRRNKFAAPASAPRPGLIILDLNMPRKDGREALKEIKANPEWQRIPVVVLTTSAAETDVAKVYSLGANSFISKPVAFAALVGVLRTVVEYWFKVVLLPVKN